MDHQKELDRTRFFDQLHELAEQHLHQAISVYQNLSSDTLDRPSVDGGWSITQCLEHLNTYHRHYLPLITTAIAKDPGRSSQNVKRGWLGNYFIRLMDPDLKAAKYKAMTRHVPAPGLHASEVVAEFIDHQERLIQQLSLARHADLNTTRVPTTISNAIRMRTGDALLFLAIHDERHIRQADRIHSLNLNATVFP